MQHCWHSNNNWPCSSNTSNACNNSNSKRMVQWVQQWVQQSGAAGTLKASAAA